MPGQELEHIITKYRFHFNVQSLYDSANLAGEEIVKLISIQTENVQFWHFKKLFYLTGRPFRIFFT